MRHTPTALGLATLLLAGCGGNEGPPVVQVSGGGGPAAQALQAQIINLQNQIGTLQQRMTALEAKMAPPR